MKRKTIKDYPYVNNLNISPYYLGFESGLNPFAEKTSSARADMFSSHLSQALVLDGAEFPFIYTGFEHNLGEYEFNKSERKQDAEILAILPKYPPMHGLYQIKENPSWDVVYLGLDDKKIHYFTIENYTQCSDGYGYENVIKNRHLLQPGTRVPKEIKFVTSPIHKGNKYCFGVNAKVAYMSTEDTIEDAMVISRSLANKMQTRAVYKKIIRISVNQHPINIYGDDNEFKFIPDIGEYVGDDGIMCAFRRIGDSTFAADVAEQELKRVQSLHDDIYYAAPGAKIINVDFFVSRTGQVPKHLYQQIEKYQNGIERHYKDIIAIYQKYCKTYEISSEFNTLVTVAMERLIAAGRKIDNVPFKPRVRLITKNNRPIEFVEFTITYEVARPVAEGFKITDRAGCKGVISKIYNDEDMPIDEQGERADIIIDPASPINRMNPGQHYEQAINRTAEFVRRRIALEVQVNPALAAATLMDFYNDINPNYAALIRSIKNTPELMERHVRESIEHNIHLNIPASLNTMKSKLIRHLRTKWQVPLSPVTYTKRDTDGNFIGTFKTIKNVCIGSKYLILLCKIPDSSSPGVAHISSYSTPIRPGGDKKMNHPISYTPIRFGEDELRICTMDISNPEEYLRLMCLQSGSQIGINRTVETLLTHPHPTNIDRIDVDNRTLVGSNSVIQLYHHMMLTIGIDSLRTRTNKPAPNLGNVSNYIEPEEDPDERKSRLKSASDEDLLSDIGIVDDSDL